MEKILNEKVITIDLVNKAKVLKTKLQKLRTKTWDVKDEEKKSILQLWNCIQKCHNIIVDVVSEKEKELEKIVKHFEDLEKERILTLQQEREVLLQPYEVENVCLLKLWEMSELLFNNFLAWSKTAYQEKKQAEEKARIDEEKRKADEIDRIKKETEDRVRKEADDEAKKREDDLKKQHEDELEKVKKDAEEKVLKEKHDKEAKELEDKQAQERLEKETSYKDFLSKNEWKFDKIIKEEWKVVLYRFIDEFII